MTLSPSGIPERSGSIRLADGRRLGWSEWGPEEGRPVLVFHGTPGSSHNCPDTATTAALGVRMIAPDRPGYGESEPSPGRRLLSWSDDVDELRAHLRLGASPLIGESSGVPFALAAAYRRPEAVTAMALIAGEAPLDELPPEDGPAGAEYLERVARRRADPSGTRSQLLEQTAWFGEHPESIMEGFVPDPGSPAEDPDSELRRDLPALVDMLHEMFRHAGRQGSAGWVDDSLAIQLPWGFSPSDVRCRTTVWYGDGDKMAKRRDSEYLASVIPGARLVIESGEGHAIAIRHWREILESVLG